MLVMYESGEEVIVCESAEEAQVIKEYFIDGGRSFEDFDRTEYPDGVATIGSRLLVRGD